MCKYAKTINIFFQMQYKRKVFPALIATVSRVVITALEKIHTPYGIILIPN